MDERIKEMSQGAGREESRINQDFIDFLSKWSTPALVVLAAIAVSYWGWNQLQAMKIQKVNKAMTAYTSAMSGDNPNPDSLALVAQEYASVRSVGVLAKLDLADVYLLAVQRGLEPGAEFDPVAAQAEGQTGIAEGDALTPDRRQSYLDKAGRLYAEVVEATRGDAGKAQLATEGAFGLAAVAESNGDLDKAKTHLAEAKTFAEKGGFAVLAAAADARAAALEIADAPALFDAGTLPPLPEPEPVPEPETPSTGLPAPQTPSFELPQLDNPPLFDDDGDEDSETNAPVEDTTETDDSTNDDDG